MPELSDKAQKALKLFEDGCLDGHRDFTDKLRDRQRAYQAILDIRSDAASWTSKRTPPFVQHIIETNLAGIVDDSLQFRVTPSPRFFNPGEYEQIKAGAKAHEILHHQQLKADRFDEKLQPFGLQDAIAGLSVMKTYWRRDKRKRPRLQVQLDQKALEMGLQIPRLVEVEDIDITYDGPCSEVVNVEDFFWHEAAIELQGSPVIAHRVWTHFSDLKRREANGEIKNVDELKEVKSSSEDYSARRITDGSNRSKDMIEELEIWWKEDDGSMWRVTIGNRAVELKPPSKNPFWHGEYPFVVCTTRPNLFAIPGISQVQKIMHLQESYWDIDNQTIDNLRLLNNAIIWFDETRVEDVDAMVHEPGARWPVEGPVNEVIGSLPIDGSVTQMSLPHLAKLEQLMQNLAGGQPFSSTSEAQNVNANTATEAALVTNLAQRSTMALKRQMVLAFERVGQQRMELSQQFIRTPTIVESLGLDSEQEFMEISPLILQGEYRFDTAPMAESLMRQEKRAEANSRIQILGQLLPIWVGLAQSGAATPPNFDEFVKEWLEAYDSGPTDRYFSAKAPQMAVPPQGGGGQPAPQGAPPVGVTSPLAVSPTSPSNQVSVSPAAMLQRAGALTGGVNNV